LAPERIKLETLRRSTLSGPKPIPPDQPEMEYIKLRLRNISLPFFSKNKSNDDSKFITLMTGFRKFDTISSTTI
jgi:hypothetical protein